jgi:AraC family transcriptional regulator
MKEDQLQNHSEVGCGVLRRIAPGPTRIISTSSHLGWDYLCLEKHSSAPGNRPESSINAHVISMLYGNPSVFDYRTRGGNLLSRTKMPETITVNPPGEVPKVVLYTPAQFIHIALDRCFVEEVLDELGHGAAPPQEFTPGIKDSAMIKLIGLLSEEAEAQRPVGKIYVDTLAHALALRYARLNLNTTESSPYLASQLKNRTSILPLHVVNRVTEKMKANLNINLGLDDLAREAGYSRGHFVQMFRASTGMTPHRFIMQLRVEHARNMLKQSKLRLVDIAVTCGFSSHAHMTHVFRKTLGVAPAELRRGTIEYIEQEN